MFLLRSSIGLSHLAAIGVVAIFCVSAAAQAELSAPSSGREEVIKRFGIVVDNSGLFRLQLEKAVKIAAEFVRTDATASEGFLVTFADTEKVRLRQDLTTDRMELVDAIENMYVESGSGALLDAIRLAADHLAASGGEGGYLLVLTNGEDNGSATRFDELAKKLKATQIRLFVVGLSDGKWDQKLIDRLAKESSGRKFVPAPGQDIPAFVVSLRKEIAP